MPCKKTQTCLGSNLSTWSLIIRGFYILNIGLHEGLRVVETVFLQSMVMRQLDDGLSSSPRFFWTG